jgi:hypothetical protein
MDLKLKADTKVVGKHPGCQLTRLEHAVDRREEYGSTSISEIVAFDDLLRKLVIATILNYELDLVLHREPLEVGPVILVNLSAGRALHVDDPDDIAGYVCDTAMATSFEQNSMAALEQDTRPSYVSRLSLYRIEDFVDSQH